MRTFYILAFLTIGSFLNAQTNDIKLSGNNVYMYLSGKINEGTSTTGSALFTLQRNNDSEQSLIRWNLNEATDPFGVSVLTTSDYWNMGVSENDNFKIFRHYYRYSLSDGVVQEDIDAFRIVADNNEDGTPDDPRVVIPQGILRIGNTEEFIDIGTNRLALKNAHFVPYDNCTSFQIGRSSNYEIWSSMISESFVTTECRYLDPSFEKSMKANAYGLTSIMKIKTKHYKAVGPNEKSSLELNPYELIKVIPEAVHTHDNNIDVNGEVILKEAENYGVKYNQIIPVLIKAIQEQQELLVQLSDEITILKAH